MVGWLKALSTTRKIIIGGISSVVLLGAIGGALPQSTPEPTSAPTTPASTVKAETVEKKQAKEIEPIPFTSVSQNDVTLDKGQRSVSVAGVNGEKTITHEVTYTNGKETNRVKISEEITKQPVIEVVKVGTYVAPQISCPNGTYVNSSGNTVCSPYSSPSAPSGASARCADGTYSFSQSRRGTCSSHGGVAQWL